MSLGRCCQWPKVNALRMFASFRASNQPFQNIPRDAGRKSAKCEGERWKNDYNEREEIFMNT